MICFFLGHTSSCYQSTVMMTQLNVNHGIMILYQGPLLKNSQLMKMTDPPTEKRYRHVKMMAI